MEYELKTQVVIEPVLNASYDRSKMETKFRELVRALNKANTNVEYDLSISDDNIYSITVAPRMTKKGNEMIENKEGNIMIYKTEAELHALLDILTDGEHVKAAWKVGPVEATAEGPVSKDDLYCSCFQTIRWRDGDIVSTLVSLEVARDEEVITVTRNNEKAMHALLDSLEEGETVTAEWGTVEGAMSITGTVRTASAFLEVNGYVSCVLRQHSGILHYALRSVTVRRTVVQRWEREDDV